MKPYAAISVDIIYFYRPISANSHRQDIFFHHLKTEQHTADTLEQAIQILHITSKGTLMSILEEIEIYLHTQNYPLKILNEQIDVKYKNISRSLLMLSIRKMDKYTKYYERSRDYVRPTNINEITV